MQKSVWKYANDKIGEINESKLFVGLIILVLNLSGRYVNVGLSKTVESYLTHTFSRNLFIFCVVFMPTRSIITSLIVTTLFSLFCDYLLHENSSLSILPESFTTHHLKLLEEAEQKGEKKPLDDPTEKEKNILEAKLFLEQEGYRVFHVAEQLGKSTLLTRYNS